MVSHLGEDEHVAGLERRVGHHRVLRRHGKGHVRAVAARGGALRGLLCVCRLYSVGAKNLRRGLI
jgi:hypothetical protein